VLITAQDLVLRSGLSLASHALVVTDMT
jgi:hypothetical protein